MLNHLMVLLGIVTLGMPAQAQSQTFANTWGVSGFASYQISLPNRSDTLYESEIFVELDGNEMRLYNVQRTDPLGSITMCGGLGCDLDKTNPIGNVTYRSEKNVWLAVSATGKASFLRDSFCQLQQDYLPVLVCLTKQGPGQMNFPTIIRIVPGT